MDGAAVGLVGLAGLLAAAIVPIVVLRWVLRVNAILTELRNANRHLVEIRDVAMRGSAAAERLTGEVTRE